ncbi:MAG TPA: PIN domain-containing protein [Thermoprotei archaeon]|nr:PIN domain-containing protein [Thermoprotei archaeon]
MRIIDADILSYALLENHIATPYTKPLVEKGLRNEVKIYVTFTTLLETYNVLYWYYHIRPRRCVARKILSIAEGLILIKSSSHGFYIAVDKNVPLGDAILVATALENNIPIIISNDRHVERLAKKYGLIIENPIPQKIRKKMK